jgi:dUTP pyrophosphatase
MEILPKLKIKFTNPKFQELPKYATPGSSGMDLIAALDSPKILWRGDRTIIPTGIAIELPDGFEAQVRPRSGLAAKNGLTVLNSPGTVDSDYRNEIGVILINFGKKSFKIIPGMRIAQLVICPVQKVEIIKVEELGDSERGLNGFGSTGI